MPDLLRAPLLLFVLALLTSAQASHAQSLADRLWTDVAEGAIARTAERDIVPERARTVRLDRALLAELLAEAPPEAAPLDTRPGVVLPLPTPEGAFEPFRVVEAPVMAPGLQARFPELRSFLGRSLERPGVVARISLTPDGFRALVLGGAGGTALIDPFQRGDAAHYAVYRKADYAPDEARLREAFENERVLDELGAAPVDPEARLPENGALLRTYRLAVAATGEYSQRILDLTGNDPDVSDTLEVLAAQVVAMTRVNGIYERDLSVRMELVENNDEVIYFDPATDPYTNNNPGALLSENQTNLDAVIGSANYDVGHVFSTGGGGLASLGVVCDDGAKARGETGLSSPIGDIFYVDFVAHELGHQFRGNHTFNGSAGNCAGGNRNGSTAFEPGSGSTIMAYAGICSSHNIQTRSDDYFHTVSLIEIVGFITNPTTGGSCGAVTETENEPPTVSATGDGLTIPIRTPFFLTGSAADDGPAAALTYAWEEFDLGPAGPPAGVTGWNGSPPFFRSFDPTATPTRYFPQLDRVLDGLSPVPGEGLPIDGRTLQFRLTARDNAGGIGDAQIALNTAADAGPFVVTFGNDPDLTLATGSEQEITWDVAGTDANGVDAAFVDILYSSDGGASFPTVLAAATPNDGAETVTLPVEGTDGAATGRVMIVGTNHIFFDVNDEPFVLGPVANSAPAFESADAASATEGEPFSFDVVASDPDGDDLTITASGLPAWLTLTDGGDGTATLAGTPPEGSAGSYDLTLTADDGALETEQAFTLTVGDANEPPVAADDAATTDEDEAVTIDVLANDTDADGDDLTVTDVSAPGDGAAEIDGDGTITYTPAADFAGTDTFTYTVSDGNGGTDEATVTVTVTPVNDAPTAATITEPEDGAAITLSGDPETPVTVAWTAAEDAEGDALLYRWEAVLAGGDFADPLLSVETEATSFETTYGALDAALAAAGVEAGESVVIEHRVVASDGSLATAGPVATVTLTRGVLTDAEAGAVPASFAAHGAYPNPAPNGVRLALDLPWAAEVTVEVYDVAGRQVAERRERLGAGRGQAVELDDLALPTGVYVYRVVAVSPSDSGEAAGRFTIIR
jgi:hypothetical protein